jgi:hypothetical protein
MERGVGWVRSSDELPIKSAGSEGTLFGNMPSERPPELIGMETPTTGQASDELSFQEAMLPPKLRELRQNLGRKAEEQKRFRYYSL